MAGERNSRRGAPWMALLVCAVAVVALAIGWLALKAPEAERMAMQVEAPSLTPRLPDIDSLPNPAPAPTP